MRELKKILKGIKGVFKPPRRKVYFGGRRYFHKIFSFNSHDLLWKDKFSTPRMEHPPTATIQFYKWSIMITWLPPKGVDEDDYWEQVLWYLYYYEEYGSDKPDIKLAEEKWPWTYMGTEISTWYKNALL